MTIPEEHYRTIDILDPKGVVQVYDDRWWWCIEGDPHKAIFYRGHDKRRYPGSPQCNGQKEICERIKVNVPGAKLIFIERGFVPWEDD